MAVETKIESRTDRVAWPATLCEAFQRTAARFADQVALRTLGGSEEITWGEYAHRVQDVAAGLAALGIGRGDTVGMMLGNRPEALVLDTAAVHLGATPFSLYPTASPEQIEYYLGHADARVVVCEATNAEKILEAGRSLPGLEHVFVLDGPVAGARDFAELARLGGDDFDFEAAWRAVTPDDVAVLIYTSGTTGPPKAAEIMHSNVLADWKMTTTLFPGLLNRGRTLSFLPMAHLADRMIALYPSHVNGSAITCVANPRELNRALLEVRPTFFASVPRMWEKIKLALELGIEREPDEAKRAAVRDAVDAGLRKVRLEMAGRRVPEELAEACRRADEAVFSNLRAQVGFDQIVALMSGAAPVSGDVLEFLAALGLPICETWGMTEATSCVTTNPPDAIRIGTVGKPLPGVELRLADDGELLVRGASVMRGYRKDPEKTADAIDADGWLRTGDVGTMDADGYVRIVDRKKELIINAAGKNMSPANIELKLKAASNLMGPVVAIGDGRRYNTALIVLDPEGAAQFARANGMPDASVAAVAADERAQAAIADAVERANAQLSRVEQIKKFTILPVQWLPDSDELTPTLKLKRKPIAKKYAAEIEAMYAS
jgi:long-chain acyl-CoA synthetase